MVQSMMLATPCLYACTSWSTGEDERTTGDELGTHKHRHKQASKQPPASKGSNTLFAQRERESVIAMLAVGAGSSEVHGYMQLCSLRDTHMQTFPDVYHACLGTRATQIETDAVQREAAINFARVCTAHISQGAKLTSISTGDSVYLF